MSRSTRILTRDQSVGCPQWSRLLNQLREVLRRKHYSSRTEETHPYWVGFVVGWHGRNGHVPRFHG
jgi:hypothetical protein